MIAIIPAILSIYLSVNAFSDGNTLTGILWGIGAGIWFGIAMNDR